MKRRKGPVKKRVLLLLLIAVMCLGFCSCNNSKRTQSASDIAEQIEVGMTYKEVRNIIGSDGSDIGSGMMIMEWRFLDDELLQICFDAPSTNATPNDWIVSQVLIIPAS